MYTLSDLFIGDFRVSQQYGVNAAFYKQFGLAGHEGVDYATPVGVPVLAPFDGVILRDTDNPKSGAYGTHLVIWDPTQKCAVWYCHLASNRVSYGERVQCGQVIGLTGNTGNSTGPHLHVNLVETDSFGNRTNLSNGYQGFLNILNPKLVKWKAKETTTPSPQTPVFSFTDQTKVPLGEPWGEMEVQAIRSTLNDLKRDLTSCLNSALNSPKTTPTAVPTPKDDPVTETVELPPFLTSFIDYLKRKFS